MKLNEAFQKMWWLTALSWHCICGARYSVGMNQSAPDHVQLFIHESFFVYWLVLVLGECCGLLYGPLATWHWCCVTPLSLQCSFSVVQSQLWVGLLSFPWEYTLDGSFGEQGAIRWCRWQLTGGNCLLQGYTSFLWIFSFISTRCKIRRSKHELAD